MFLNSFKLILSSNMVSLTMWCWNSSVDGPESPVAPPRTRKSISLSQSSLSSTIDIPAATAIAGGIPANHELPYMTPPLPATSQQQHFSGDSQDSSSKPSFLPFVLEYSMLIFRRRKNCSISSKLLYVSPFLFNYSLIVYLW